jgi:heme exporter protein A
VVFAAQMHGLDSPREAAAAALERMGANAQSRTAVRLLSRGQQQRVSIARALVHSPDVVLLDEPFAGLDDAGSRVLADLLGELRTRGATLVIVTHNLADGLQLGTHAAIMLDGVFAHFAGRGTMDAQQFASFYRRLVGRAE